MIARCQGCGQLTDTLYSVILPINQRPDPDILEKPLPKWCKDCVTANAEEACTTATQTQ